MNKIIWSLFIVLLVSLWLEITGHEFVPQDDFVSTDSEVTNIIQPLFKDETLAWGLHARHQQSGDMLTGLNEVLGGGACVLDYDGDGWEDVFVVGGSGQHRFYGKSTWWSGSDGNALWENTGEQSFTNVSDAANIPKTNWGMGCAAGDLDNDGDTDLLILNIGENVLLRNNGNGSFTDISKESGMSSDNKWSMSASLADYDGDGLLDIYITNFIKYEKAAKVFERSSGFVDTAKTNFDPVLYNSQSNNLYQNKGNLSFTDKAHTLGVADSTGRGKAARWLDVNNDMSPDLIVLNSGGSPNKLYINQGKGRGFVTNSSKYHVESTVGSHSAAVGDVDNDGEIDMIFSRPSGTPPMLLVNNYETSQKAPIDGSYEDVSWHRGLAKDQGLYQEGWGTVLSDFNNDGWLDIYMANGLATIDEDSKHVTIGQDDALWVNKKGSFELVALSEAYRLPGRGVVSADFNNDGFIDLLVTQNNDFVRLLINKTKTNSQWLGVVVIDESETPVGAKITLLSKRNKQIKQTYIDSGYLSQGTARINFSLPEADEILSLKVEWPDGSEDIYTEVELNKYLVVKKNADTLQNLVINESHERKQRNIYHLIAYSNKRLYIELLSLMKDDERVTDELLLVLNEESLLLRKEAMNALYLVKSKQLLTVIYDGLSDKSPVIRLYAIELLEELELERSVPWLISALSDINADVRCSAAKAFEVFFKEEEAVIFRKYLAVPALVKLLDDPVSKVKICAANAIAESESYRAIVPLLDNVFDDDVNVSTSMVRALGFIRDEKASRTLSEIVMSEQQPAVVRSHALIALKRLGTDTIDELLNDMFVQPKDKKSIRDGIDTLAALLDINESILFDWDVLHDFYKHLKNKSCQLKDEEYCSKTLRYKRGPVDGNKTQVMPEYSLENKDIKKVIYTANNKSLDLDVRRAAFNLLSEKNTRIHKALLLKVIDNESGLIVEFALSQLKSYHEDPAVRKVLWKVLMIENNTQTLRLLAAKGLAEKEPLKVIDTLFELDEW